MVRLFFFGFVALAAATMSHGASAQSYSVVEPKKIASEAKLKPGQGAMRLSVRAQFQSTETLFVYFIEVLDDGTDGTRVLRFERGAGVPLMGSNMIDAKPMVYAVAQGRYRPLAFTLKCDGVPFPGAVCTSLYGGGMPTGYYSRSSPIIPIAPGQLSEAGDFIVEFGGDTAQLQLKLQRKQPSDFQLRWRAPPLESRPSFSSLQRWTPESVPDEFRSRIKCDARPAGVMLHIPFDC